MSGKSQLLQQSIKRIAIVRSLPGLSDLLCTVPALRALRTAFPQAKVTLIGLPWASSFVERFSHLLDEFLEFPGYPGIPEISPSVQKLPEFFTKIHEQSFDLALQMHGNGIITNSFTSLLGARINAGFYLPGHFCPDHNYFLPYPETQPEIYRYLMLMEYLGIPLQGDELEFPCREADFIELNKLPEMSYLQQTKYACIHPGASVPNQCWSVKKFAAIADALNARGIKVVLTGTAMETSLTQAVAQNMQTPAVDIAGKTSLGAMAALLMNSTLLVCNYTGISHLAAALRVPSVVISSNSDVFNGTPTNCQYHRVLNCEYQVPSCEWVGAMKGNLESANSVISAKLGVTLAMVMEAIEELLGDAIIARN